jgi:hypothetical protein
MKQPVAKWLPAGFINRVGGIFRGSTGGFIGIGGVTAVWLKSNNSGVMISERI